VTRGEGQQKSGGCETWCLITHGWLHGWLYEKSVSSTSNQVIVRDGLADHYFACLHHYDVVGMMSMAVAC
jgi:hypothetical protein